MDQIINFGKVTVSTGYAAGATSVVLSTGDGAKLPAASTGDSSTHYNLIWWNATDYPDASDDPNKEIVRVTNRSTDTLTVTRAQESTSDSSKNTTDKTYLMICAPTKKTMDDISSEKLNKTGLIIRHGRVGKVTTSGGVIKTLKTDQAGTVATTGTDGDKYFVWVYLDGTETKLELSTYKYTSRGIFDIYLNGVLDSSGYDDYASSGAYTQREITLTQTPVAGLNVLEFRVNGKNASATSYEVQLISAIVQ